MYFLWLVLIPCTHSPLHSHLRFVCTGLEQRRDLLYAKNHVRLGDVSGLFHEAGETLDEIETEIAGVNPAAPSPGLQAATGELV